MSGLLASTVGAKVKRRREQRGMSAAELARRAGVSKANLSGLEAGRGNPTLDTLDSLAAALTVPLVDLLDIGQSRDTVVVRDLPPSDDPVSRRLLHRLGGAHGLEVWRLRMAPRAVFTGVPHSKGTVEHLAITRGQLFAGPAGEEATLNPGDLVVYAGDREHAYAAGDDGADVLVLIATPYL